MGAADEGCKDHVYIVLDAEPQVILVFLGESRQVNVSVGQIDTLLGRDEAVVARPNLDRLGVDNLEHVECQHAIVDIDDAAGLDDLGDVLIVDIPVMDWVSKAF